MAALKRRILKEFVLDRIAAVDRPCQEHAKMTIMKRRDPRVDELDKAEREPSFSTPRGAVLGKRLVKLMLHDLNKGGDGFNDVTRVLCACPGSDQLLKLFKESWQGWGDPGDLPPPPSAAAELFAKYVEERAPEALEPLEKALGIEEQIQTLQKRAQAVSERIEKDKNCGCDDESRGKSHTTVPFQRGATGPDFPKLKKRVQALKGLVRLSMSKAWSDEARQASAEARRAGAKGKGPTMTHELARGVGMDAGNRSMRAAGRTAWNADDFHAASAAHERARGLIRDDSFDPRDFEGPELAKPGEGKTYRHKTSGKEIVSTRHPGSEWEAG